ncbi:MAG TPA: putative baseplate assembly protein [Anaerolineaceae bacterium]|nr:putative baseplate assembly protein [Anaerolineaceae bacterium]
MPLPCPNLDDLRFQRDLVDEARKRIIHYCPEWTEYNLSDPGITLIELFAWMTEMMVYRLNRVPDKNYIKFLDLLGLQYRPASSARADLTFWLSTPLPISEDNREPVIVPAGMEIRMDSLNGEDVIFSTDFEKLAYPPRLIQIRKDSEIHKNYASRMGIEIFEPFQASPKQGDTFFLGFAPDDDLSGHTLRLQVTCEPVEAVGIRRQDPPLVWEASLGDGRWKELRPSVMPGEKDTTGGLNNPSGELVFYLPMNARPDVVHGQNAYWLRCRYETRESSQGHYTASPRLENVVVTTIGVTVPSTHARIVDEEVLGTSNGEPGQTFTLLNSPVLGLGPHETLEVEEFHGGETVFVPWTCVDTFANSTLHDRHFTLEPATGAVSFGPAIRQPDGTVRQYGRIPESGRVIRFKRYRFGGGASGNVPANTLQTMTSSVSYLARVNNLNRASGGRDQEGLEELKMRAQRELQSQKRVVTASDFEQALLTFSRGVARVRSISPREESGAAVKPGTVELLVVPSVADAIVVGDLSRLGLSPQFVEEARAYLDQYRLLTTSVHIREPHYTGVQVCADIAIDDFSLPEVVQGKVVRSLQQFLSPLPLLEPDSALWELFENGREGWEFGRGLFVAEISSLIQRVPGVRYVLNVQVFTRPVDPERERLRIAEIDAEEPLTQITEPMLWLPEDGLTCPLIHQINIVDLNDIARKARGGSYGRV